MGSRANPKLIGAFVLGAIGLVVAGVIVFSSGMLFRVRVPIVMYFRESVGGLDIGAPVNFNGVTIGSVTDIDLVWDLRDTSFTAPVYAEILPESLRYVGGSAEEVAAIGSGKRGEELRQRGLRAQLGVSSIITGRLQVNLVMRPDTPAVIVGGEANEIPTIFSDIAEAKATVRTVVQRLAELEIEGVVGDLRTLLQAATAKIGDAPVREVLEEAGRTMADARTLIHNLDRQVEPLAGDLGRAARSADGALTEAERMFGDARTAIREARTVLDAAAQTLNRAKSLIETTEGAIQPGSPIHHELVTALREVSGASRSIRSLADTLERSPNSVLFGRRER
jgi:paraquat-inducible protein B